MDCIHQSVSNPSSQNYYPRGAIKLRRICFGDFCNSYSRDSLLIHLNSLVFRVYISTKQRLIFAATCKESSCKWNQIQKKANTINYLILWIILFFLKSILVRLLAFIIKRIITITLFFSLPTSGYWTSVNKLIEELVVSRLEHRSVILNCDHNTTEGNLGNLGSVKYRCSSTIIPNYIIYFLQEDLYTTKLHRADIVFC
jgi:hypothetical protein